MKHETRTHNQHKPGEHLFSPHTYQCIYCGKNAADDAVEHTPCGLDGFTAMARTTRETVHGNPGERRILPANTLVAIIPAANLPPESPIKYWAHPVEGHPWPAETAAWAEDVGVGLGAEDIAPVNPLNNPA